MANNIRLGDILISVGLITDQQLSDAISRQAESGRRLGAELIDEGIITEAQLIEALQYQLGIEYIDLTTTNIDPEMSRVITKNLAKKYNIVPVRTDKDVLYLAMSDPLNFVAIEDVRAAIHKRVVPMITNSRGIDRAIMVLYGNEGAARAIEEMKREAAATTTADGTTVFNTEYIGDDAQLAPTIRLVNSIIERAVSERASDIHLEPTETELRVRMRVDGMMRSILTVPRDLQGSVVSRLKVMGSMDISEHRIPQDGRCAVKVKQTAIDLRLSILPTIYGEKVTIRLLDKNSQFLNKGGIGLTGTDLEKYTALLRNNSGVILIVGPTGSGKSSTMYTMIRELNSDEVNLTTLEDPVEYNISGINQVQINEKTGMTFAGGLRSILRQDPDIIAVGEIRDGETAEIAMRAAMTGHLVLSTIHTNDAISTLDRLLDIGVAPYMIASSLKGVISQRLVRRICPQCKTEYTPTDEDLESIGLRARGSVKLWKGKGCANCFNTGYLGRTAVFEILTVDREVRSAVVNGLSHDELQAKLKANGDLITLSDNCRRLVIEGQTTIEEAQRTISSGD